MQRPPASPTASPGRQHRRRKLGRRLRPHVAGHLICDSPFGCFDFALTRRPNMDKQPEGNASPPPEPVVIPDVATSPHAAPPNAGPTPADVPKAGEGVLQEALPEISEAARKV